MSYAIWFKAGCQTTIIAPAGVRMLSAIHEAAQQVGHDLTISEVCGAHPPKDPHSLGNAIDVRSHDLSVEQKAAVLEAVMERLSDGANDPLVAKDGGFVTRLFFGWLEHPGKPDEHFHYQLRNGHVYP